MAISELPGDETSDDKCRTFVFENEGHTLGNALRSIISRYPEVTFCGYTLPHPAENKINFRIQTMGPRAVDVLKQGLVDLEIHCGDISDGFQEAVSNFSS